MKNIVSTEELASQLGDPKLVLVDATVFFNDPEGEFLRSGKDQYATKHLPGAVFYDQLAEAASHEPIPFQPTGHERFLSNMEDLGINADSQVVIYDSGAQVGADFTANMWAARLAWQLAYEGFPEDQIAILEGGLDKWASEGRPLTAEIPEPSRGQLNFSRREELLADLAEVEAAVDDPSVVLLDSLPKAQYDGDFAGFGDDRVGHIPSAINVFFGSLSDPETGALLPEKDLRQIFADLGVLDPNKRVITYCGFGIAACWLAAVLKYLGQDQLAMYDGSLMEWATQTDNELEV
ncbi:MULTISPECIES: sulfurtransferase [Aerococcus]|uniref:Sulfurtransferase n=2 Tax=Aerococcus TaxID=1375 RepID=A0A5N1GLY7_9LACT|nr:MULTISPECIES: sulfurtransferase [Aerococcus]KAA9301298.1 sulfurtransferase [Aerococcus sanguinicola]MDK6370065.1 sulfurtransferase [Aerococcus sp. UMB9870]MDK6687464.1 sulfurtransferase [Aerococcus sp. UMB8623]MDK6940619.1 sulfurtransferase [Aerococcus sp. UMB8487]OFK20520.1 rhodanese-like domain-containing protein [Aerococcus sp. HMSC072A12]